MEIIDAEARGDHGIIFKKIGPELRVVDGGFKTTIPAQAVAVSNKFGLTFFIHSKGNLPDSNGFLLFLACSHIRFS